MWWRIRMAGDYDSGQVEPCLQNPKHLRQGRAGQGRLPSLGQPAQGLGPCRLLRIYGCFHLAAQALEQLCMPVV